MGREPPKIIPDLQTMATIRASINRCVASNDHRAVTAILRIRREQYWARPINRPQIISLGIIGTALMVAFAFRIQSGAGVVIAVIFSIAWIGMLLNFNRHHPHRDEKDIPEREHVDSMVRLALEQLVETVRLDELELDDEDKKDLTQLYAGENMPSGVRMAILRAVVAEPLPDV